MLKTLLLTHEYYPFGGGVGRYCHNLFKYFPPDKYLVICDHPEVKDRDNVRHLVLKNKVIRPSWLFSFFKLRKIIKEQKIEQIFTANILPLGTIAYLFFRLYKIPYVISLHGLDINNALKHKPYLTKKILQNAKKVITNSQYTLNLFKVLPLDFSKVEIIYPSVEILPASQKEILQDLKKQYNLASGDKIILTVARLNYRKGIDLVIKALAKLNQTNVKYLIVGSGEEKMNLENLIEQQGLSKQVVFCGRVTDQTLADLYQLADIFVMPNRDLGNDIEGFGAVFLEAASFGLPIIAGKNGGVMEILTDKVNALLVDSDDSQALFGALSKLLSDDKLAKALATAALSRSRDFVSYRVQSDKLAKILT